MAIFLWALLYYRVKLNIFFLVLAGAMVYSLGFYLLKGITKEECAVLVNSFLNRAVNPENKF